MPRMEKHPVIPAGTGRERAGFSFNGQEEAGLAGEPISSALMALGKAAFSLHPKDGSPQGLFCANGQCSQCTVLVDGVPKKACMTPLAEGMDIRSLPGLAALPAMDQPLRQAERRAFHTDILVIGGGPAGLSAAYELGRMGYQVAVADDKERLGGKLVLQTHKFFGSEQDCYAGMRGTDIASALEEKLRKLPNVAILRNSPVVAIYKDRKAGIYKDCSSYLLVEFTALIVAAGAREKNLLFPGNDLPGVFGAGAFQTLVNRDLVAASRRILVLGSGNVGLIAAYHALQAGMQVAAIVEIMGRISGYKVHADKIRRMGVPIQLNASILWAEAEGEGLSARVARAAVAKVDDDFKPLPETVRVYEADTILVAAGLSPCDEFLRQAKSYGILALAAGDAQEIAEASSAMYGGKIAAFDMARMLGRRKEAEPAWLALRDVLKSRPGDSFSRSPQTPGDQWRPVFFCSEEIPCNPCATACPEGSISLRPLRGTIMDLPYFSGTRCSGCMSCVAVCPGLAVSLVRRISDSEAEVVLPWEFPADFPDDSLMDLVGQEGEDIERAPVTGRRWNRRRGTWLLTFRTSLANAARIAGVRVQPIFPPAAAAPAEPRKDDRDPIVCRCERVRLKELAAFIKENKVRDVNQLKSLRVGMGACGGKTCSQLVGEAFALAGVDPSELEPGTSRPLFMEIPMGEIVNEGLTRLGGRHAGSRGAP